MANDKGKWYLIGTTSIGLRVEILHQLFAVTKNVRWQAFRLSMFTSHLRSTGLLKTQSDLVFLTINEDLNLYSCQKI